MAIALLICWDLQGLIYNKVNGQMIIMRLS